LNVRAIQVAAQFRIQSDGVVVCVLDSHSDGVGMPSTESPQVPGNIQGCENKPFQWISFYCIRRISREKLDVFTKETFNKGVHYCKELFLLVYNDV
jgi:hypothetical protein